MPYNLIDTANNNYDIISGEPFTSFDAGEVFLNILNSYFPSLLYSQVVLSERKGNGVRRETLFQISFNSNPSSKFFVYCFQTEGGGRSNLPNESRIQWRKHDDWVPDLHTFPKALTFQSEILKEPNDLSNKECYLLSFYKRNANDDDIIISAAYPTQAQNVELDSTSSKSIQFSYSNIREAFIKGFSQQKKGNDEYIFHFKPQHLIRYMLNRDQIHKQVLEDFLKTDYLQVKSNDHPLNTIYYGAPGTGKSHKVDKIIENLDKHYYERVTFHPEFDNANFIGSYKPISEKVKYTNSDGEYFENEVHYKFVPQAFTNIYERAWKDLEKQYYLVIEEINRGNCAEIFGEIFQLLDRTSNYTVSPSKELKDYLVGVAFEDKNHPGIVNGLKLPSNLSILATMNTSDQSLFPMDSAFKRRWDWEYVPICYDQKDELGNNNDSFDFEIDIEDGQKYSWIKFIEKVNLNHIKNNPSLGMDKCIGNYFIKPEKDKTIALKPFINKVIFYLWNDVFKDEDNNVFEKNTSYEDFFPTNTHGKEKIKALFERIDLKPVQVPTYTEEEPQLGQVAQPQKL